MRERKIRKEESQARAPGEGDAIVVFVFTVEELVALLALADFLDAVSGATDLPKEFPEEIFDKKIIKENPLNEINRENKFKF